MTRQQLPGGILLRSRGFERSPVELEEAGGNHLVIWSGLGFLVAVITFLFLFAAEYVTESFFGNESYYQTHGWPKLAAFFVAGAVVWPLGAYLNRRQGKVMVEKEAHSFFFVRMEYWGPILFALGIIFLFL